MTNDQERLVTENLAFARFLANRYARVLGYDESFSAACLGLVRAALSFDPTKGFRFSTHAAFPINGSLLDEVRRQKPGTRYQEEQGRPRPSIGSLDEIVHDLSRYHPEVVADRDPLPDEQAEAADIKRRVFAALKRLEDRDGAVLAAHYVGEFPLKAIGRQLGVGESRTAQLKNRGLARLRQELADLED